jgi:rare lipoprotein A (peptidoglycan hydrolase)
MYRITTTTMTIGLTVLVATAALCLGGLPPAYAEVTPAAEGVTLLGVDASTATTLAPEVPVEAKFDSAATTTAPVAVSLIAPSTKRVARISPRWSPDLARHYGGRSLVRGKWRSARASWYGPGLYGNGMAGGGKLRRNSMVVAHKSMRFGTKILFTYRGRSVIAVVKDRGPYVSGRTFDLGPGTAKALHFDGVGRVRYRIVH